MFLVKNSFAEKTPFAISPGIFINLGKPAPEPMKTASKPCSFNNSSTVIERPTITFVSILTPNFLTFSIVDLTTVSFGKRNSGIP